MLKRIGAASFATLLCCAACSKPADRSADGGASTNPQRSSRAGIVVPMPDGWRAEPGPDMSLVAGPAGRTILRVDQRQGGANSFPSPDALERAFAAGLPVTRIERERVIDSKDFVGLRLDLSPPLADGGEGQHHDVFIGARRIGKDLFLCATSPGASEPELDLAQDSCEKLTWSDGR